MKRYASKFSGFSIGLMLLLLEFLTNPCFAQIPGAVSAPPPLYGGAPTGTGYGGGAALFSPGGYGTTGPVTAPTGPMTTPTGTGSPAPVTPGSGSSPIFGVLGSNSSSLLPYDPMVDNHLRAPATSMGLFGRPIKEVEGLLKSYGAKPHSYAFGKYSKMTFSVYLITLNFSRERKLGSILIDPLPPFSNVEHQAKQFLMRLFLEGANMKQFATTMSGGKIEIKYNGD